MTDFLHSYLPSALQTFIDAFLLLYLSQGRMFIRPSHIRQWAGFILIPCAATVLFAFVEGSAIYLFIALSLSQYIIFLATWQGRFSLAACYYALCYLLISNCIRTEVGLLSQKALGYDILFSSQIVFSVLTILAVALFIRLCLGAVRHFIRKCTLHISCSTLALSAFSAVPYLFVRGLNYWLPISNEEITGFIGIALASSCALGLIIIVGSTLQISASEYRRQIMQMQSIMEHQQSQFALKMQSIDNVNRKYHDLKNVLLYLENHSSDACASEQIRHILGDIRPYEILQKTGNGAVDVILNEKLAVCAEKNISCVPYINGCLLDFIDPVDLCIIFGNALDNAIECCERYDDPTNRRINIKIAEKNGMITLLFRNFCLEPPAPDTPFFTSKADMENHGFGLLNIRSAVEKYNGEISIRTDGGEFRLTIVFSSPNVSCSPKK